MVSRRAPRIAGVTLLEVLLALMLMGLVLAALYVFTESTIMAAATGRELAARSQLARVVIDRIANEVRQAAAFGSSISGDKNSIRILCMTVPDREIYERRKIQDRYRTLQYDLTEVRYYLKIYEDEYAELEDGTEVPAVAGLFRREWRILGHEGRPSLTQGMSSLPQAIKITVGYKPIELEPVNEMTDENVIDLNPGIEEPFAPEIKCLKFQYHDGKNWVSRWAYREDELTTAEDSEEGETTAPSQTTPSIPLDEEEEEEEEKTFHPDRYTIVVRLYQSDPLGLGSKLARVTDELYEQFGSLSNAGLGPLGSLMEGGTQGLGDLSGKLGQFEGLIGDQLRRLGGKGTPPGGGPSESTGGEAGRAGGMSDGEGMPESSGGGGTRSGSKNRGRGRK